MEFNLAMKHLRTLQLGNDWFGERQGGLNRVFSELLKHLPDAGVQVRGLVAGSSRVEQITDGKVIGFASAGAPLLSRLYHARKAALQVLREEKPDLIVSHFALYTFPILDQLRKVPTVIHFHGPWAAEGDVEGSTSLSSKAQAFMERAVYARGRRIVVLSQAFRQELLSYGIPEDQIRVVPAGVDTDLFNDKLTRAQARTLLGWPTDRPIVLSVRRQVRRMGLENLIDAVIDVRKQVPDVLVLLGGTGPLMGELRDRIASHGLEHNVRQLGRIEDENLPTAYRAADLSVVPTQALEGFGMITLESLASGTPALVTPVGGLPEVILPFAPECVFAGTSAAVIAATLSDFLTGRSTLPADEACRHYATANFSWPVVTRRIREVYEDTLL